LAGGGVCCAVPGAVEFDFGAGVWVVWAEAATRHVPTIKVKGNLLSILRSRLL